MSLERRARIAGVTGFVACAGLIGVALYLQYVDNLEPCPLCMMQRIAFFVLGLVFLALAIHGPRQLGRLLYLGIALAISLTGLGLASRHVWLQWNPPPVDVCSADLFFQLSRYSWLGVVGKALRATGDCAKVDWTLLGLSIAQWSWICFAIFTVFIIKLLTEQRARLSRVRGYVAS